MAYDLKCYCCGNKFTSNDFYYCLECLVKLNEMFEKNVNVVKEPNYSNHCISCGEFENRKILYNGNSEYFPEIKGEGVPICDICVKEELNKYK